MKQRDQYAQGDVLLERLHTDGISLHEPIPPDPDGAIVLARGEASGHRHALHAGAALYRDATAASDMPAALYLGHLHVAASGAVLVHEEHAPITLPPGLYRVRRQREYHDDVAMRTVQD